MKIEDIPDLTVDIEIDTDIPHADADVKVVIYDDVVEGERVPVTHSVPVDTGASEEAEKKEEEATEEGGQVVLS